MGLFSGLRRLFMPQEERNVEPHLTKFRKAAEQGDAAAQYCLGVCYDKGKALLHFGGTVSRDSCRSLRNR
jgi:hypothetical protein